MNQPKTITDWEQRVEEIEAEWDRKQTEIERKYSGRELNEKVNEITEYYSEKRLFAFERIAELQGNPIL